MTIQPPDELDYYSPAVKFFSALAQSFAETGQLDPEAFYLILDWKASRARTKHLQRLVRIAGSFDKAVAEIARALHRATEPERLCILMNNWSFKLPSATAILSILYPDTFTIYDVRVCRALGKFDGLGDRTKWTSDLWQEYQKFRTEVRKETPPGFSLRNRDRWLWGKDKRRVMRDELRI